MKLTNLLNNYIKSKKLNIIVLILLLPVMVFAQKSNGITLDSLQYLAREHYPYFRELILTGQYADEDVKSINTKWLPQFAVTGKLTGQSEVTHITLPETIQQMGFTLDEGKKIQYQAGVSVTQMIYDGGLTGISKKISRLSNDIQAGNIEMGMLQIESTVNTIFENVLIMREQISMLDFNKKDLEARKNDLSSALENGMAIKADWQDLNAELLSLEQKKIEATSSLENLYEQLSFITQQKIDTAQVLVFTKLTARQSDSDFSNRPDYKMLNEQLQLCDVQKRGLNRQNLPQLTMFANGYYGCPGINYLDYSDHFSGIVGLQLQWNINHLYTSSHNHKKIEIQKSMLKSEQDILNIELNRDLRQIKIEQVEQQQLISKDDDIVKARAEIRETAQVQFENGTMTFANYLDKLNAESLAIANRNIHKIKLFMCTVKENTLMNKK